MILADGGANKLYQTNYRNNEKVKYIVGDLDSLKPEVEEFYTNKGAKVHKVWNQNKNDFEKAV